MKLDLFEIGGENRLSSRGNKMKDENKTKDQLISEMAELRKRIDRLEGSETEGKGAETIQLESEEKLNLLVESIRDVLFQLSPSGFIRYVSPNVKELYGYSPEELIGKHLEDITPTSESPKAMKAVRSALSGKTIEDFEINQIDSEGKTFPVEATITPVEKEGKVMAVHGLMRDITERKRAEDALRESNQTLLTVLNSIDADVYVSDLESYRVLFMNTHMQDNFGKDLVGKQCYKVFRGEKEPCAHCTNDRLLGPNGEPTGVVVWEDENPVTNRSYRNYDKVIKWIDGRFVRLQVATDITDLKQAEEEQKKLEAQLWQAQKVEALGTIAGGIAHNFNNILMAIQGNASLMLLDTDPTHPNYERLKSISRSVQSGSRLTSQLLGYARKGRYQVRTTNLNELVRETSDTFGMAKREIRVHRNLAEDLSMINADPAQIEQVLLNLYVNASDVMPRGGDLFLRTTNVTHKDMGDKPYDVKPGDYVLLTVRDTGTGMDKKTMERIFDPFFTTKGMGRGTGLGLSSVYGIIKAHSGYIDVESKKGHGTTFSIYLPASEKKVIVERQKRAELLMGTGTVLLVDDEAMILDVEAEMLRTLGYKVLLARSGKEAIELYKANKDEVDMVILDMVIPDMGGGETYDKIKEINSNVKVLLSSGYSLSGHPREILERGCDAFIQKPFDIKGLSQKISEILDTR
jgi:two-component system cell cycle sensor histidine kinase/response regulator CckA